MTEQAKEAEQPKTCDTGVARIVKPIRRPYECESCQYWDMCNQCPYGECIY